MRKTTKNFIVLLIAALVLAVAPVQKVAAEEGVRHNNGMTVFCQVNPLYEGVIDESYLEQPKTIVTAAASDETEYLPAEEASAYIREKMAARSNNIRFNVVSGVYPTEDELSAFIDSVIQDALVHTGIPTEGDYLRWQYAGYRTFLSYYTSGTSGYYTVTLYITYYTSAEQEAVVDETVEELLTSLNLDSKTDYEKVWSIYDYICTNVEYDYVALENPGQDLLAYTAYGALIENSCVCQGYANLFYRLALELGVDARLITGTSDGQPHAWNIVELGNRYYNLDSTWDAGRENYWFFLRCEDNFPRHIRNAEHDTAEFHTAYPMAEVDYDPNAEQIVPGDINGDGNVNARDVTKLLQYLAEWDVEVVESALDINGDGNVNVRDVTTLKQYIAGWDVEIF